MCAKLISATEDNAIRFVFVFARLTVLSCKHSLPENGEQVEDFSSIECIRGFSDMFILSSVEQKGGYVQVLGFRILNDLPKGYDCIRQEDMAGIAV